LESVSHDLRQKIWIGCSKKKRNRPNRILKRKKISPLYRWASSAIRTDK